MARFLKIASLVLLSLGAATGCSTLRTTKMASQASGDQVQYLKENVLTSQVDSNTGTDTGKKVCLPAGLPVIVIAKSPGGSPQVLAIDASAIGGWGRTYADPLPTDCRNANQPIFDTTDKDNLPDKYLYSVTAAPSMAAVAGDPAALVKSGTFKSGFLGYPLSLDSLTSGAHPPIKAGAICLPRGARISIWMDATDMARTVVEPVDQQTKQCDGTTAPASDANTTYYAPTVNVASAITSSEFASGVLAVPFKYYIGGDKSFAGSSAVGPYIGWRARWSSSGTEWTAALFGGYTSVAVPTGTKTTGGAAKSNSISGMTFGIAFLTTLGDNTSTQAGLVWGHDYVSENVNWVNNRKNWIALQFGYAFF